MNDQKGMSLVEVLVALLLLTFVILSGVTVLTLTLHETESARVRSIATSLAVERVEELTVLPFRGASSAGEYLLAGETLVTGPPIQLQAGYNDIDSFPDFRRVVTLNYDVPSGGMLQVVVDVFWQDLRQGEKSHRVTSFLHPSLHKGL